MQNGLGVGDASREFVMRKTMGVLYIFTQVDQLSFFGQLAERIGNLMVGFMRTLLHSPSIDDGDCWITTSPNGFYWEC
jgi:hypothetical protein